MKNIFICTTKYQLFNIANIIHSYFMDCENDLLVLDCIPDLADELQQTAKRGNLFDQVLIIKAGPICGTLVSYVRTLETICFPSTIKLPSPKRYDRIFITATEVYSRVIACMLIKENAHCQLYYYEDGMASYTDVLSEVVSKNRTNRMLNRKFGFYLVDKCRGMYVYRPEFILHNQSGVKIRKIPNLVSSSKYAQELKAFFSVDFATEPIKLPECIYFDANFNQRQDVFETETVVEQLINILGTRMVVKPHPSKAKQWKTSAVRKFETNDSFEIYCLNHSVEHQVLISAFSTACILPKLIFDQEPKVILTYKLYRNYPDSWKNGDQIYYKIKKSYRRADDFWIPESKEELVLKMTEFLKGVL